MVVEYHHTLNDLVSVEVSPPPRLQWQLLPPPQLYELTAQSKGQIKKVKFLKVKVFYEREKFEKIMHRFYTFQLYFEGTFTCFNVNIGLVTEFHSTLKAFAHFSYVASEHYLLIYNLQEIQDQGGFVD